MAFRVNYITFARDVQLHINNKDYGQIKCIFREEGECQGRENQCLVQGTGGEVAEGQRKRIAYDYFVSGTRDGVMMICETWQNEEVLKAHMATEHFTSLVPKIEALTKNGLKLEQFAF